MSQYFDDFVMQCCKAPEWELRKWLKRILIKNGFSIQEDEYRTSRVSEDARYKTIHNMLAIRGNPRTCLVAHTDVCRDHAFGLPEVKPELKMKEIDGENRIIIQDANCETQVGGDDRLGVAINTWIALNSGYDMGLLFTTDEEIGLISADYVKFDELNDMELLVQVDRGNHSNQLVNRICATQLCGYETTCRLLKIADDIGLPRYPVNGMLTDVLSIKNNGFCKEAINMTCGYHNSFGAGKTEYIDVQEARDTMKYVASIVKYYYLEEDKFDDIEGEPEPIVDFETGVSGGDLMYVGRRGGRCRGRMRRYYEPDDLFSEEAYMRDRGYINDIDEY